MPVQAAIELGLDIETLSIKKKAAVIYLNEIYEAYQKLNNIKTSPIDISGFSQLNKVVSEQNAILTQANKVSADYVKNAKLYAIAEEQSAKASVSKEKAIQASLKTQQEEEKLRQQKLKTQQEEIATDNLVINQINLETAAEERLAAAKKTRTSITTEIVPGTTVPEDVGRTTGIAASDAEIAATAQQLAIQKEDDAEREKAIPIIQQEEAAVTETVTSLDAYTGTLRQNITAQIENNAAIATNQAAQKEITIAAAEAGGATEYQKQQLAGLIEEELILKQTNSQLSATIRTQVKDFSSASGSTDELRAKLTGLIATYESLSVAEKQSAFGAQIKQQIDILQPALTSAEAQIGKFQRNVGNYSGGITKAFSSAFSYLRQIAYIIPGLGIAGIFNILFQYAGKAAEAMGLFGKKTDDTAKILKSADEIIKEQTDDLDKFKESLNGVEASALASGLKLQAFVNIAKDGEQPLKVRNQALVEANKILGEHGEKLTLVNIATAAVTEEVNKYTNALIQQAIAGKYADKIADLTIKRTNQTKDYTKAVADLNNAFVYNQKLIKEQGLANVSPFDLADVDLYKEKIQDAAKVLNNTKGQIQGIQGDFNTSTEESIKLFGELGTKGKAGLDTVKKAFEDAYNLQKAFLTDQINENKALANDSGLLYTFRAEAAQKEADLEMQLSQLTFEFDQRNKKNELLAEYENAARIKQINVNLNNELIKINKDRAKLQQDIPIPNPNEENNAELKALEDAHQKGIIEEKEYYQQLAKLKNDQFNNLHYDEQVKQQLAKQKQVNNDIIQGVQAAGADRLNIIASETAKEENIINEKYAKGLISETEYQNELLKIQVDKGAQALAAKIQTDIASRAQLNKFSDANQFDAFTKNIDEGQAALAKIGYKLDETTGKLVKFADVTKSSSLKKLADDLQNIADIVNNLGQAFQNAADISFDNQKTALEEIGAQEEKNFEQAQNNIQKANLSDADRAAQLTALDTAHAARQEEIARKQREADNEKAEFDKKVAILDIIVNTAVAVVKALGTTGPFAIPLAIAVGILGAAQLAAAVATKVPHYRFGTQDHKGGDAIVAEAGQKELVQHSGKSFIYDKPTYIKNLPRHAKVIPLTENANIMANRAISGGMIIEMKREEMKATADGWEIARWQTNQMKKILRSKGKTVINVHNDFGNYNYLNKNVYNRK